MTLSKEMEGDECSITHISNSIVKPFSYRKPATIHLTPWDLRMLTLAYGQHGVVLPKPPETCLDLLIARLKSSLALTLTLDHFYPLAGRLAIHHHDTALPSLSVSIDCNNQGAEFIVSAAKDVAMTDILAPTYTPRILPSLFPLNGALGLDGHSLPLLAVQLTELADGLFLGTSFNHVVVDGTSFWHFFSSWSEISRTNPHPYEPKLLSPNGHHQISRPPILDRWFPDACPIPIPLPYNHHSELVERHDHDTVASPPAQLRAAFLHFSAASVAALKAKANAELKTDGTISSLQALMAHLWRSITRSRRLPPDQECIYHMPVGARPRINPPLPAPYFGNSVFGALVTAPAGKAMEEGLGWMARQLHQAVASHTDAAIRDRLTSFVQNPSFLQPSAHINGFFVTTGGSPRFDVFGNDFGWGKPIAVRGGASNKRDGSVMAYPGRDEDGSIALQVCLSAEALSRLLEDDEFMEAVSR